MNQDNKMISWADFERVEIRKGTILRAEAFPEARNPSYKVWVDFGEEVGVRKTSAQITRHYELTELPGRAVMGVTNFPAKQIGPFMSEFLLLGFEDEAGDILLAAADSKVPDGALLK